MPGKELIVLIGLPRSGKSTLAERLAREDGIPIVCPDAIRLALHGERFIAAAEKHVWAIADTMVRALFLAGHEAVIADACHGTRQRREQWRSPDWRRRFLVVDTSKEECLRRARELGDAAIQPVIERMAAEWEPLGPAEIDPAPVERITSDPKIFAGKPIVRGRRLAVEHVLGMLAAGDTIDAILEGYPWLEREDVLACQRYASLTREAE